MCYPLALAVPQLCPPLNSSATTPSVPTTTTTQSATITVRPTTTTNARPTTTITYGTLVNIGMDDDDNGYVVINGADVITAQTGTIISSYVQQISLDFVVAPSTTTPTIWLYAMNQTSSNVFVPTTIYQLSYSSITTGVTGTQTMVLPANALPVTSGQYVGVGFGTGGGSCYRVSNRDEYYFGTWDFSTLSSTSYKYFSGYGFAFSFNVLITSASSG